MWTKSFHFNYFRSFDKVSVLFSLRSYKTCPKTKCLLQPRPAINLNMVFNEYSSTKNHMMPTLLLHVLSRNFPYIKGRKPFYRSRLVNAAGLAFMRQQKKKLFFVPVFTTFTIEIFRLQMVDPLNAPNIQLCPHTNSKLSTLTLDAMETGRKWSFHDTGNYSFAFFARR